MKLSQFTSLLQAHADKPFHLTLPGLNTVPVSFHITEVGHVQKKFIDCGGKLHTVQTCQLQAWLGEDTQHRLLAGKMAKVLNQAKAKGVLPGGEDLDVEVEYEDIALSQYPIVGYAVTEAAVVLSLAAKHTDCLAEESCLPTLPMALGTITLETTAAGCCGSSGCC